MPLSFEALRGASSLANVADFAAKAPILDLCFDRFTVLAQGDEISKDKKIYCPVQS